MTKYREIVRLSGLGLSQTIIALSCNASKITVNKVLKAARERKLSWPLDSKLTAPVLGKLLFLDSKEKSTTSKRIPDYDYIRKELLCSGVNKKPLWTEYLEECCLAGDEPLMYSQFCYYIQQNEQKCRATMHINRKLAEWKQATVQFNYHISFAGMLYSVPYEYIKRKVDVRVTDKTIEIFYNHNQITSHRRLYGRKGQYSTVTEHMPTSHQQYLKWNGDRVRKWAERVGSSTYQVVDTILTSKHVEQQSYRSCMGLLKLADKVFR